MTGGTSRAARGMRGCPTAPGHGPGAWPCRADHQVAVRATAGRPCPKLGRTTFFQDAGNRQSPVLGPLLARNGEPEGPRGPDQASVERKKANLAVEPAQDALGFSG